ncbi:MAG: glutathione-disulfide reductase [Pseudomonadales bacterium]|nr:glutathione-disulfide reductase [Pseudomonadales bacterium]
MATYDYDLFVIGAGSGGVRASRMASQFGAKVAVAEDQFLGGTCVNVGCVPKKLFSYASHFSEEFRHSNGFGWSNINKPEFDWCTLVANKDTEISRLNGIYDNLLGNAGVTLLDGRARLVDSHTVAINNKQVTADKILLATGGWPYIPEFPGKEHVISSNEIFYLKEFPKRLLVVGGGYIAVEFAGIFAGLGADITLSYRGPLFLRNFDDDIRNVLATEMAKKGINLAFNTNVTSVVKQQDGSFQAFFDTGENASFDSILYATGRKPNTTDLGLENVDIKTNPSGTIVVDQYHKTSVDSIYALGDLIEGPELTPVALREGTALANTLFNNTPQTVDYSNIPTAVFSHPNIGTVGLTEEEARKQFASIEIYKSTFRHLKHTLSGSAEKTFMKLIVNKDNDIVLGVHMIGADAGEIIQGLAVALKAGATKSTFDSTIGIHPTAAEEFVTMREPASS